jgi:AAHS family benzoate transporter-like MFS transporter
MSTSLTTAPEQEARRRRTVTWVVSLAFLGLIFDGYDLVVYGTVLSTFLRDPSQIGPVTPALGGVLGSYALVGVLVGALLAGTMSDVLGRRKLMLLSSAWFSVGMAVTALTTTTASFGLMRFVTGLCNAIVYSGVPFGSLLSALLAILLLTTIGWRGMFLVGALPIITLVPLAFFKMPESPNWLMSRGRSAEAHALAARTGISLTEQAAPVAPSAHGSRERAGFAGLFSGGNALPAILLGFMSVLGLVLVYAINTWLPELMLRAGFNAKGSLSFLLVSNGGAVIGALAGSRIADRFGPKLVVACSFLIGAVSIGLLTLSLPLGVLLLFVAIVGLGTSGTQTLIYGFVANYFRTNVRGAAVAWCAGFGRLGGVGGPLLGGLLVAAGLALNSIFFVLAVVALIGTVLTLLVPSGRTHDLLTGRERQEFGAGGAPNSGSVTRPLG